MRREEEKEENNLRCEKMRDKISSRCSNDADEHCLQSPLHRRLGSGFAFIVTEKEKTDNGDE